MTKTELNQQIAKVLAGVEAGERLSVTDRGRPIAELIPNLQDVVAAPRSSGTRHFPQKSGSLEVSAVVGTRSTREILDDIHSERL